MALWFIKSVCPFYNMQPQCISPPLLHNSKLFFEPIRLFWLVVLTPFLLNFCPATQLHLSCLLHWNSFRSCAFFKVEIPRMWNMLDSFFAFEKSHFKQVLNLQISHFQNAWWRRSKRIRWSYFYWSGHEEPLNPRTENWKLPGGHKQINFFNWTKQWNNLLTASLLKLWLCIAIHLYIWSSFVQRYLALAKWLSDTTSELTASLSTFTWKKGRKQARNSWSGIWKFILALLKEAMLMFSKTFDYQQPVRVFWSFIADDFILCPGFGQCLADTFQLLPDLWLNM